MNSIKYSNMKKALHVMNSIYHGKKVILRLEKYVTFTKSLKYLQKLIKAFATIIQMNNTKY